MIKDVIKEIEEKKIIAIIRGVEKDKMLPLVGALRDGGITLAEVTFAANRPDEETAETIRDLVRNFSDDMAIGSGTTLTEKQVELTHSVSGRFVISPDVNEAVIGKTKELGMISIPGALTPTEIVKAARAGADFVKLFPITGPGAEYVKAVKAPLSNVKLLAVGGIDANNMSEYLRAGVLGFGIGSKLTDRKLIENNDWKGITALAKAFVTAAHNAAK